MTLQATPGAKSPPGKKAISPTTVTRLKTDYPTITKSLKAAGYATGHFGKWHLNGVRGPGVPILGDDANHPGRYGFDEWLSASNFYDRDPLLSRNGKFEEFKGDSSVIVVAEALKFMQRRKEAGSPFLTVIWYGSPHNPQRAVEQDLGKFPGIANKTLANHLGEIVGIDRSIGQLRKGLRDLGIQKDTLVWYCSDNGGLTIDPDAVGNLRGHKGSMFEGGIRVPLIVRWPGKTAPSSICKTPVWSPDLFPTFARVAETEAPSARDGVSLEPLFGKRDLSAQDRAIVWHFPHYHPETRYLQRIDEIGVDDGETSKTKPHSAIRVGDWKLLHFHEDGRNELYNLSADLTESTDLASRHPVKTCELRSRLLKYLTDVDARLPVSNPSFSK